MKNEAWLFLIRHGATKANESRPYVLQGRNMDLPLSETGRRQAEQLGRFLAQRNIARVVSSPMKRAVETAQAVAQPHGLTVEVCEELTECDVGRWEGMDWDSIMQQYPDEYQRFMDNPAEHGYLEGETYSDVLHRVQPALQKIIEQAEGRPTVVVAHNVVNRAYLSTLLGIELRKAKSIPQNNTGVNVIRQRDGELKLLTLNAVFHLDELP